MGKVQSPCTEKQGKWRVAPEKDKLQNYTLNSLCSHKSQSMKKTSHINAPYKLIGKWLQSTKMSQQIKLVRICEVETKIKTNSLIDYIPLGSGYIG